MLREALAGRRIAITGATGFLGTALTERVLRCLPDTEVVLLVRPGRRGATDRVERDVLRNDCFQRLRRGFAAKALTKRPRAASCLSPATSPLTVSALTKSWPRAALDLFDGGALGRHGQLRCTPRRRGRGQPARPVPGCSRSAARAPPPPSSRLDGVRRGRSARGPAPEALPGSETPFSSRVPWREEGGGGKASPLGLGGRQP